MAKEVDAFYIKQGFSAQGLFIIFGIMLQVRILRRESGVECSQIFQVIENFPQSLSRDVSLETNGP